MIIPFIQAVYDAKGNTGLIAGKLGEICTSYGYYNLSIDRNSHLPAMKNFLVFLKLMKPGRGKYVFTPLGKAVLDIIIKPSISTFQRAQCDRDVCREICPANVIDPFVITSACIQSG